MRAVIISCASWNLCPGLGILEALANLTAWWLNICYTELAHFLLLPHYIERGYVIKAKGYVYLISCNYQHTKLISASNSQRYKSGNNNGIHISFFSPFYFLNGFFSEALILTSIFINLTYIVSFTEFIAMESTVI